MSAQPKNDSEKNLVKRIEDLGASLDHADRNAHRLTLEGLSTALQNLGKMPCSGHGLMQLYAGRLEKLAKESYQNTPAGTELLVVANLLREKYPAE